MKCRGIKHSFCICIHYIVSYYSVQINKDEDAACDYNLLIRTSEK